MVGATLIATRIGKYYAPLRPICIQARPRRLKLLFRQAIASSLYLRQMDASSFLVVNFLVSKTKRFAVFAATFCFL
jgi:hypothetical protein